MKTRSAPLFPKRPCWSARRLAIGAVLLTLATGSLAPSIAAEQDAAVVLDGAAPDFNLESIDGTVHGLGDLRGEKNVIVVFFRGTW